MQPRSPWGVGPLSWCRRLSGIQVVSHLVTFYAIGIFAAVVQPVWLSHGASLPVLLFWVGFAVSLTLYLFVCIADTRYHEVAGQGKTGDYEIRRCDECSKNVAHTRVKHCQTCGGCTEGFDHHCRYLNVCIGQRTYTPWLIFVAGLASLMAACCAGALDVLVRPWRSPMSTSCPVAFYALLGTQVALSVPAALFLACLLAQHLYFIYEGITTLEYIKDQAPGFPGLPPKGWREAVLHGECHTCSGALVPTEANDPSEVWFCSICQVDLARAGLPFLSCSCCENVNVCPMCRKAAEIPSMPVVTYRVSVLRRRAFTQTDAIAACKSFRTASHSSHLSATSFGVQRSSGRDARLPRRTLSTVVAAVEGHSGDASVVRWPACCRGKQDEVDEEADSGSESGSESSDGGGGL